MSMKQREFYEVHVTTVDANGAIHIDGTVDGETYPKVEDSKLRAHDVLVAMDRARGMLGLAESKMSTSTGTREIQYAYIIRGSDGYQMERRVFGKLKGIEVEDSEPEGNE